jgi:cytochrome c2
MRRTYLLPLLLLPGLAAADSRGELSFNRACASCHVTVASAARAAPGGKPAGTKLHELNLAKLKKVNGAEQLVAWLKAPHSVSPDTSCDTRRLDAAEVNSLISYLATASQPLPASHEELQRQNLAKQHSERRALDKRRKAHDPSRSAQGKK